MLKGERIFGYIMMILFIRLLVFSKLDILAAMYKAGGGHISDIV